MFQPKLGSDQNCTAGLLSLNIAFWQFDSQGQDDVKALGLMQCSHEHVCNVRLGYQRSDTPGRQHWYVLLCGNFADGRTSVRRCDRACR